jgi:membrane carboxypeptidase/penicillin-binding protein PbpC
MTQEVLEKKRKSLLEDHDYEEKVRVLNLNKRIEWFVDNKPLMSQNEKWYAFYDIHEDYEIDVEVLKKHINNVIRKKGLSVW